jgi:hypothetical protein
LLHSIAFLAFIASLAAMARKLDAFPGGPRYDWEQWLDGTAWILRKGEDFEIEIASMRAAVSRAAKERGLTVRTKAVRDEDGTEALAIQASRERAPGPPSTR